MLLSQLGSECRELGRAVAAGFFFLERENNMAAVELEWIPETLYNTAISAVVDNYSRSRRDIRSLPENIQFDVYYKVMLIAKEARVYLAATRLYEFV